MTKITRTAAIKPPRPGSKQAQLVDMLGRKNGVTLDKASEALSWKTHTTSAVISGLRKRGYNVQRIDKGPKPSAYVIAEEAQ